MAVTRLGDVIVPEEFTAYTVQNTMEANALVQSGIVTRNAAIEGQLTAGADSFTVPFWNDLADDEANIANDDPDVIATPRKLTAEKQIVRKSFLHNSWSAMNLASELAGADALTRIQDRASAYWSRQTQRRLIASLNGILADNIATDSGDMVLDVTALTAPSSSFGAEAVIDAAGTLGDQMGNVAGIAVHSDIYRKMLKLDLVEFIPDSTGRMFATYRGMAVVMDDLMPKVGDDYTTALFAPGAVGWGITAPNIADGTEIENKPGAGNGGGQQILHSRVNLSVHPSGFAWAEDTVADESPTIAELALAANWRRVVERKAVGLAFLKSKL
ncbi:major capsid protein [Roseinatronobacter monicus]|uniref:HK97 family phage major capsid protein n=1 Tax=Roseinatronobacter monicus TaxID=393481 RepID=A0A543KEP0_9RHOB|nr:major capsid protein [Roseinatronobacter monicus]TQM93556.1 hypothetical protein BD293_2193 [Roseinatronobacter monicus]